MRFTLIILMSLIVTSSYAQQGSRRFRVDTVKSFTPGQYIDFPDSIEIGLQLRMDSIGIPHAPPSASFHLFSRALAGYFIQYANGNVRRLDTSYTGVYEPVITPSNTVKQYWNGFKQFVTLNTDSIVEGSTNLFFTNARARSAISANAPITYNSSTGVIGVDTSTALTGLLTIHRLADSTSQLRIDLKRKDDTTSGVGYVRNHQLNDSTSALRTNLALKSVTHTMNGTSNRLTVTGGTQDHSANTTWSFDIPANAQLSIAKITNLTTNGFVKTGSGDGTLSVDGTTYLVPSDTNGMMKRVDSSKLFLSRALASGSIWMGGAGGGATQVTPSGDWTISNTGVATLKNTGTAGTYGDATHVPQLTFDAQGRETGNTSVLITPAASSITSPAALTKVDDTNVTLTLTGSPTVSLLAATGLTLGWTGTLSVARGGIGVGTLASNGVLYGNGTSAVQALAVNSTATNKFLTQSSSNAPAWATIVAGDLPGSFSGFANPSVNVTLSVQNGSATTAMRSDAAPALSQAIAPTWSANHLWQKATQSQGQDSLIAHILTATNKNINVSTFKQAADTSAIVDTFTVNTGQPSRSMRSNTGVLLWGVDTSGNETVQGDVNAITGFKLNGAATSGNVLRGNGTRFVSSTLAASDIASPQNLTVGTSLSITSGTGTGATLQALGLNTIQGITTASTPQFARLGLGAAADGTALLNLNSILVHGSSSGMVINGTSAIVSPLTIQGTSAEISMAFNNNSNQQSAIYWYDNTNTGGDIALYRPASTRDLRIYGFAGTAGDRVTFLSTGNVGIGTTSPTNILSLGGQSAQTAWMERNTTSNTAGNNWTLQAGGATSGATDKNGGTLILTPGASTGTGLSNVMVKGYTVATSTGTTDNTQIDREIVGVTKALSNNSLTTLFQASPNPGTQTEGSYIVTYEVDATNGTEVQVENGRLVYTWYRKTGDPVLSTGTPVFQQSLSSGTLSVTWSGSTSGGPVIIKMTANSNLSSVSAGYPRITYKVENLSQTGIALQ